MLGAEPKHPDSAPDLNAAQGFPTQTAWGETWVGMVRESLSGFFDFGFASYLAQPPLRMTVV
jgi:hypothetical protein